MNWVNYLIQINLYLTLFYGFYLLFLRNETFFTLNRMYLLGSAFFSALIPLIQTEWVKSFFITEKAETGWQNIHVMMMGFASPIKADTSWTLGDFITVIYLAGVLILLTRLCWNLARVRKMFRSENHPEAFSFFRKIKVNENLPQKAQIEKHEQTHAQQLHSADVLFFEILSIINWFNPVVYLYQKAIRQIHEFIADEKAIAETENKKEYALLLFSKSFGINPNTLTNNFFNQSLLKRRIQMLQKPKSRKMAILKYGLSAPLFLLAMILSSATISKSKVVKVLVKKVEPKHEISSLLNSSLTENPKEKSTVNTSENLKNESIKLVKHVVNKDTVPNNQKTALNEVVVKADNQKEQDNMVFTSVEVLPTFPGGIAAFSKFLQENLKYPALAKANGIEGRVFLNFVVEKDGSLSDIKVVRGIGSGCDEEAVRVLAISPKWNPGVQNGKKVRVSYIIPIFFQTKGTVVTSKPKNLTPEEVQKNKEVIQSLIEGKVLLIVDGKEIEGNFESFSKSVKPENFESINVLKGDNAIKKYGDKGKNGVIEITTKKKE
ncbi:MAG: TonB family protein [Sphingobacteriales bacterium]|nr:TonB family protein [Sphingobacteriales bacterium]